MLRSAIAFALTSGLSAVWAADVPVAQSVAGYQADRPASLAKMASSRQARYQDGAAGPAAANKTSVGISHRDPLRVAAQRAAETAASKQTGDSKLAGENPQTSTEPTRPAQVTLRKSASHDFRLWDAGRSLISDVDDDGYFRRFEIRFDADVSYGDALVYAKLYLRRVGDSGDWQHYYTTDDFWIYGESDSDDYYVETLLNDGYPTAEYDVLVDLYESGYSGIVATMGPFEDSSLRDLPLEDSGLDLDIPYAGFSIGDVDTTLLTDRDNDGYYSRFTVSFDPDHDSGSRAAYAVLRIREPGGDWETEHTSAIFTIDVSGDADRYSFTAEWQSGYPTARYDMQIDLYDAGSQQLVASVSSERPELSRVPLEDADRDDSPGGGGGGGGGDSDSDGSGGGGSMSLLLLGVVAGLLLARARLRSSRQAVPVTADRRPGRTKTASSTNQQ
ncbi:MAG TPA: choice-of-anchor H family protein [Permianibacter sp.]|nr:choice-of-anchor H family protein [Permianibacter sp.]